MAFPKQKALLLHLFWNEKGVCFFFIIKLLYTASVKD